MAQTVLIIEGDSSESQRLSEILAQLGLKPETMPIDQALDARAPYNKATPALAILDMEVPSLMAMPALNLMKERFGVPVIALIGHDQKTAPDKAVQAGASEILFKPVSAERVEIAVRNLLKISALEHEITRIRGTQGGRLNFPRSSRSHRKCNAQKCSLSVPPISICLCFWRASQERVKNFSLRQFTLQTSGAASLSASCISAPFKTALIQTMPRPQQA